MSCYFLTSSFSVRRFLNIICQSLFTLKIVEILINDPDKIISKDTLDLQEYGTLSYQASLAYLL